MINMSNKMDLYKQTRQAPRSRSRVVEIMKDAVQPDKPTIRNADGYPAYEERGLWQEFSRNLFANIIRGQFYKSKDESALDAYRTHIRAVQDNPYHYLQGLVKSRELNFKAPVEIGLAVFMSYVPAKQWKLVPVGQYTYEDILVELAATLPPKQMLATAEMLRMKIFGKGLGTAAKRVFARAMATWTPRYAEYYAVTYKNEINQLLRLIHPPRGYFNDTAFNVLHAAIDGIEYVTERQKIARWLMSDPENLKISDDKFGELLIKWDIDWQSTKALKNVQSARSWFARMMQMSFSALLLNLASLERHGVFRLSEAITYLGEKMDHLDKSRLLPFEVARAYMHVGNPQVRAILRQGMVKTFTTKLPEWQDVDAAVFMDISGSMSGEAMAYAASIAASLLPSMDHSRLLFASFDTKLYFESTQIYSNYHGRDRGYYCPKITGEKPEVIVDRLFKMVTNGGTNTSVGIQYLLDNRIHKDVIIMVTDEQQNTGYGMYNVFKQYKQRVNPNAKLYIVNPTDYKWHNAFQGDDSVFVINTLTPVIFRSMPQLNKAEQVIFNTPVEQWITSTRKRRESFLENDDYEVAYAE